MSHQFANAMDPMSRKYFEHVYQALFDAGVNPTSLNGKRVGVFTAVSFAENERIFDEKKSLDHFGSLGISKGLFSNRVSYWLNITGPSSTLDAACNGSMIALQQACAVMNSGECEAAIVGGCNICLLEETSVHYGRVMKLSKDGETKSFDENANGLVRSEAVSVLFLQKAKDAFRIYGEIVDARVGFESVLDEDRPNCYGFMKSSNQSGAFLRYFYKEAKVLPQEVEYVEGFGAADPEVDKTELEAIEEVFCKNREDPILVGSVTSNIGYCDAASGICGITKVMLGYESGILAGNLNCRNPRKDIRALQDGRMRIVTEHTPFRRSSYAAVNGLSYTGTNGHVLLKAHYKHKNLNLYKPDIPYLVTASGRNESAVQKILDNLKSKSIDSEQIALLHIFFSEKVSNHMGRGFTVIDTNDKLETVRLAEDVQYYNDVKRRLWFVYSGMGSQWAGMGKQLMRIPIFAAAIERCRKALEPKGLNVIDIITSSDGSTFDNILHSFVGITAIQIGLTDVLGELGVVPDNIIGHSMGEHACAYADGCLTAEETILSAYARGLVSLETPFILGSMAAVGLGYNKLKPLCPPEIEVACHNGPESSTISGPAEVMKEFVSKLTAQGIFAKEVPCSNIAYHSRYIADAGPKLHSYLSEVIRTPKLRSKRWTSTSIPTEQWNEEYAKYSSPWYYTNNLLSPVLFEETSKLIPDEAVVVEIAPYGLLQAILKRSLPPNCRNIPLAKRGHPDNVVFLLEAIGRLYVEGYDLKLKMLYPEVELPVSTGTPMLSHLVEWNHTELWDKSMRAIGDANKSTIWNFIISIYDEEFSHLTGHIIRDKRQYPFSAALVAAWDTLAMASGVPRRTISVQLNNINLYTQPIIFDHRYLRIRVHIQRGTGYFEVTNEGFRIITGFISTMETKCPAKTTENIDCNMELDDNIIYSSLYERGYSYKDEFRCIHKANSTFTKFLLVWQDNWVTLIDGMIQLNTLSYQHNSLSQPRHIKRMVIDVKSHPNTGSTVSNSTSFILAERSEFLNYTRCGGVFLEKIVFCTLPSLQIKHKLIQYNDSSMRNGVSGGEYNVNCQENVTVESGKVLQCPKIGDLDSLSWVDQSECSEIGMSVKVFYVGINNADVKTAMGLTRQNQKHYGYGMAYSGTVESGVRVMGVVRGGAASERVVAVPELTWPVPAHWTLEDAATVPLAYVQALYCLGVKSQLLKGMKVLVHGGAGALGQAAISIALAHQCEVFTTVSTLRKKRFLLKLFPELEENHVGNSRDHSFGDMVLQLTNDYGCDIILSCVKGGLKNATLKCASYCGITIDVAQAQTDDDSSFGMFYLTKQRSYKIVNLQTLFDDKMDMEMVQSMLSDGIVRGWVRPLSRVTYAAQEVTRAFRLLAASRHYGSVLLRLHDFVLSTQPDTEVQSGQALRSTGHTLFVTTEKQTSQPIQRLCSLADIQIPVHVQANVTLNDLGLDDSKLEILQNYILQSYNVWIDINDIPSLSIERINDFHQFVSDVDFPEVHGLDIFFSNITSDELKASTDMVFIPTQVNTAETNEIKTDTQYLYIIPGLEGLYSRFNTMCEGLKLPAIVLQPSIKHSHESVQEAAQRYVETLLNKAHIKNGYYLMGYETGVMTALEIAFLLETKGITGTIFCVGNTPEGLKAVLEEELGELLDNDVDLQDAVVLHICKLILGKIPVNLGPALRKTTSWQEKIELGVKAMDGRLSISFEYACLLMKSAYERVAGVRRHACAGARALRSRVVLLRAAGGPAPPRADLQLHSQRPVLEHALRLPLAHVAQDTLCATIINQHLHKSIRDEYESKSLCDTYFTDYSLI